MPVLLRALPLLLLLSGCVPPEPFAPLADDGLYPTDRVLQIDITMKKDDWQALLGQQRHYLDLIGASCLVSPPANPYTWFEAEVTVDGVSIDGAGVRKKGFYGTPSQEKPSLKIDLDRFAEGQRLLGVEHLTLNNNVADPSQIKQCLGYQLYAQAGVPASRCGFAVVSVNGDPLGTYSNVEPIKRRLLEREFGDPDGNLYEGALSDFRPGWVDTFERKNNEDDPDRSDIEALVPALQVVDDMLLETLDPLVDVDRFHDLWALDVLLMQADGYARNTNNFYLYREPATGRFQFIPWGIDVILEPDFRRDWEQEPPPGVAWAVGVLARRLYLHPEAQAAWLERLALLRDEVWVEEDLLAEIDRMEAVWAPHLTEYQDFIAASVEEVRAYVRGRGDEIDHILAAPPAAWDEPLRDGWCLDPIGALHADFEGAWDTLDLTEPPAGTGGSLDLSIDDESFEDARIGVTAGPTGDGAGALLLHLDPTDGRSIVVRVPVALEALSGPFPVELPLRPGAGGVYEDEEPRAFLDAATLWLDQAGPEPGATLLGSLDAALYPVQ